MWSLIWSGGHVAFLNDTECHISGVLLGSVQGMATFDDKASPLAHVGPQCSHVHDPAVHSMFDVDDKHSRQRFYNSMMEAVNSKHPLSLQPTDVFSVRYSNTFLLNAGDFPNWFTTSTGLVCMSYAVPQQGFVAAVFYGAATPFLPQPLDNGIYKFVGKAYVHGTMQVEALLDKSKGLGVPVRC
jgi:hypothetical protein